MLVPNIFGGFDSRDLPNIRIGNGATMEQVMTDIRAWAAFFEKIVGIYEGALATSGTDAQGTFGTGTAGGELQPYTEYGETEATRTEHNEWAWGCGIRRWRDRQMYSEEYLMIADLAQIAADTVASTNRYLATRLKMLLRAITRNTNYVYTDNEFPGEAKGAQIPVFCLFNADGNAGRAYVNNQVIATGALQHYIPSLAATVGLANFTLGRSTLRDLGLTGRVIHLISPADEDTVRGLPGFVATAATGQPYAVTDPAPAETTAVVTAPQAIGSISNGGEGDGEVVVYPFWPQGYTLSYDRTKPPPLYIREHTLANLRGYRLVQDQSRTPYGDGDLRNKRWEFIAAAAVQNRGNGVVVQATTGAYTPPQI
jgi:hypothetical protein